MPLNDIACKNAKCPAGKLRARFTDMGGTYLEVMPTGGKLWRWTYRYGGKEKRLALGSYPAVSLGEARKKREEARTILKTGVDPVQVKADKKAAGKINIENNFEAVARAWFAHWKDTKTARHSEYVIRRLEADVFPDLGRRPIADITALHLLAVAKKIETRGALDIAKRCLQTCSQIFRYALVHGLIDRNPAADVKPGDALKPRRQENYARLEAKELPELLRKINVYDGSPHTRLALQVMALTFVRTAELIESTWDEFDLDAAEWRIPASRMKMRTMHIVPLSTQAVELMKCLAELRSLSPMVFPGERDHDKPMSNNTILGALYRMGYKGRMTGHGFRGIASTALHEMGYPDAHIEVQLAHLKRNRVAGAYDHAKYLMPRAEMMQVWADHLDQLRAGAKILPFKAA